LDGLSKINPRAAARICAADRSTLSQTVFDAAPSRAAARPAHRRELQVDPDASGTHQAIRGAAGSESVAARRKIHQTIQYLECAQRSDAAAAQRAGAA